MTSGHIYSLDAKGIPAQLSNGYRELWRARVELENHEILVLTLDREARDKLLEVLRLGDVPIRKFDDRYKFKASDLAGDGDGLPLTRQPN